MTAQNLLCSLAAVKAYLGNDNPPDTPMLLRMMSAASLAIQAYLQRQFFQASYTDYIDGSGQSRQFLRHWPVTSVSTVQVGQHTVPALMLPPRGCGYAMRPWDGTCPGMPQSIDLLGFNFGWCQNSATVAYQAGYAVSGEAHTVPSSSEYVVRPVAPQGPWGADIGVSYASGAALTRVPNNPAQGQYSITDNTKDSNCGLYTFNAADAGASIKLSYSFAPYDVEQAVIQWVAQIYKDKDFTRITNKSLGGSETMGISQKDIPDFVRLILQPYRRVLPV
jgi:hypothetical protein